MIDQDGVLTPPTLDAQGYLEDVERCRRAFPDLHILTGVEYGQPHLDEARARQVIDLDALDRVNGSLHTIPITDQPGSARSEPYTLYRSWPADKVIREILAEVPRMLAGSSVFTVFCHIEYAVRYWPIDRERAVRPEAVRGRVPPGHAGDRRQRSSAGAQHRRPDPAVDPPVVGRRSGRAITFGRDAHTTDWLAGNFCEAMAMAEHFGFRPGRRPQDF